MINYRVISAIMAADFIKLILSVGFGSTVVGVAAKFTEYKLGKRKANVDESNVVITGAEKIVVASNTVLDQILAEMARLSEQHKKCTEDNETLRSDNRKLTNKLDNVLGENRALTERVVTLERTVARLERSSNG